MLAFEHDQIMTKREVVPNPIPCGSTSTGKSELVSRLAPRYNRPVANHRSNFAGQFLV
jgi:nicotinamide riboside kinase